MNTDIQCYSYDEIKNKANCLTFAKNNLGLKPVTGDSFNIPWRNGSDSGALSINAKGWTDFVTKDTGSIIDLCARAKYNGDIIQAQNYLGEY